MDSKKELTTSGTRATPLEVGNDGLPDICWQRKSVLAPTLAADEYLPSDPIEILQSKSGDFAGSQAKANHEKQDCEVTSTDSRPAVARFEELLCLSWGQGLG